VKGWLRVVAWRRGINWRRSERPRRHARLFLLLVARAGRRRRGRGAHARTREARGTAGKPGREEDDDVRECERGCGMEIWISVSLSQPHGFRCVSLFWIGLIRFDSGVN
jgi:hypothetical protein